MKMKTQYSKTYGIQIKYAQGKFILIAVNAYIFKKVSNLLPHLSSSETRERRIN